MEWKVAPSYANYTIVSVDENAKKAIVESQCDRCGGSGMYIIPRVFQGTCFACNGAGTIRKRVKAYTPDEYEKYLASQTRAKERKAEQRAAEIAKLEEESEANFRIALEADGYDVECPQIFVVIGENTYAVKDELKELGCKYKPEFGWYCTHAVDVPVNYGMVGIPFDQVCEWNPVAKKIFVKDNAKEIADAAKNEAAPKSNSEFIGDIKQRLRDMEVVYTNCRTIESYYGVSLVYTFKLGDNVLTWFCSGKGIDPDIEIGETVLLTGTVKDHKEYNGVKQTYLNRCIVKREG
jgi:hypothetical protein